MTNPIRKLFDSVQIHEYKVTIDKSGNVVVGQFDSVDGYHMQAVFTSGPLLAEFLEWYRGYCNSVRRASSMYVEDDIPVDIHRHEEDNDA